MSETDRLAERLSLYQIFLKLYEHDRELLNEILNLEDSGPPSLAPLAIRYVVGVADGDRPYLLANLVENQSRILHQPDATWTIGRGSRATIVVADERLSRRHAALQYRHDRQAFFLYDLDSTNGSYVNGELVQHYQKLADGDRVRLGSFVFSFFLCQQRTHLPPISDQLRQRLDREVPPPSRPISPLRSTNPFLKPEFDDIDESMSTRPLTKLTPEQQERILDRFFQRTEDRE